MTDKYGRYPVNVPPLLTNVAYQAHVIDPEFYDNFYKMYDEVSKKTTNERFIESVIKKLESNISPEQIKDIDNQINELSLSESEVELENSKLDKMFNAYKKASNKHNLSNPLREDELKEVEKILNKNKHAKAVESRDIDNNLIDKLESDNLIEDVDE